MGDALSSEISFDYLRQEIIGTVRSPLGRRHIRLWLTKRPARMAAFGCWLARFDIRWPDNLVAMTTVTGACSAQRVAELRHVPSKLRGLSLEPLFEPLKLDLRGIDWVIVGGGNDVLAAPFQIEWALDLQKQCQAAGVAFFLKQLGRNPFHRGEAVKLQDRHGGDWMEWPAEWCMREIPKTFRTLAGPQSIVPTITGADLRIDCGPAFVAAGLVGNKGAVEHGHIAIAETLLAAGVDIADPDSNPLPVAVYKTIIEIIEWLVSQRAQFDVCEVIGFAIRDALDLDPNKTGISDEQRAACVDLLLRLALQRALSYEQAVKFMKMVADLRIDCGPAFVAAVRVGNKTVVELMIRAGVDVRVKHDEPFRLAVEHGHIAIAKTLLAAGVDIADLDFNPLPMAVYKANIEMIEWLVSQRAQFDVCDVVEFAVRDAVDLDPNKTGISDEQRAACVDLVLRLAFQRALSREQAKKVMNIVAEYAPAKAAQWMAECMDFLPPPPPIGMKNRG
jgi:ankyrin repeat protein